MNDDDQIDIETALFALTRVQFPFLERLGQWPPTKEVRREYLLALMVELAELTQEMDVKSWKTSSIDRERVVDEFADVLAFLGTVVLCIGDLGIPVPELAAAYRKKVDRNVRRFDGAEPGYGAWVTAS